jgi:hypothetical protein
VALTAAGIIEDALRLIGVLSPYDTAPEPEHYDIGLRQFDLMVAQLAVTQSIWYFDSGAVRVPLAAGQQSYDLDALITSDVQIVREATLVRGNHRTTMTLIRQREFDERRSDTDGCNEVYITRTSRPIMYVVPTPSDSTAFIELRGQGFTRNLTENKGQVAHDFEKPWESMLYYGLALMLGSGMIITLDVGRLQYIKAMYDDMLHNLMVRAGSENVKKARFVKMRNF